MRKDGKAFGFRDRKCPVCKKIFVPAPFHVYDDDGVLLCGNTCYNKRMRNKKTVARNAMQVEQYTPSGV